MGIVGGCADGAHVDSGGSTPTMPASQEVMAGIVRVGRWSLPGGGTELEFETLGLGIVLPDGRHVATAHHVVAGQEQIAIVTDDGHTVNATVVGADREPFTDIAILAFQNGKSSGQYQGAVFGSATGVLERDSVLMVGWVGEAWSQPRGQIASKRQPTRWGLPLGNGRYSNRYHGRTMVVAVPVAGGHSGGAVFDLSGAVIGMTVATGTSFSLVLPIEDVVRVAETIIDCGCDYPRPHLGGADVVTITPDNAVELSVDIDRGALLGEVFLLSAFSWGGLRPGDVVLALDGIEVTHEQWYYHVLQEFEPGDTIEVTYWHEGEIRTTTVIADLRVR